MWQFYVGIELQQSLLIKNGDSYADNMTTKSINGGEVGVL